MEIQFVCHGGLFGPHHHHQNKIHLLLGAVGSRDQLKEEIGVLVIMKKNRLSNLKCIDLGNETRYVAYSCLNDIKRFS